MVEDKIMDTGCFALVANDVACCTPLICGMNPEGFSSGFFVVHWSVHCCFLRHHLLTDVEFYKKMSEQNRKILNHFEQEEAKKRYFCK
ncbi:MAG: hypothetical protein JXO44_04405 [Clostridia bacterium]|nr:hypothetical protein [Clostridia bacterium]